MYVSSLLSYFDEVMKKPEPEIKYEYEKYGREIKRKNYYDPKLTIDEILLLYGLHKQISFGDCTIEEPSKIYFISWYKYNSWKKYKGMDQQKAEELFIKNAKEFLIRWD